MFKWGNLKHCYPFINTVKPLNNVHRGREEPSAVRLSPLSVIKMNKFIDVGNQKSVR